MYCSLCKVLSHFTSYSALIPNVDFDIQQRLFSVHTMLDASCKGIRVAITIRFGGRINCQKTTLYFCLRFLDHLFISKVVQNTFALLKLLASTVLAVKNNLKIKDTN